MLLKSKNINKIVDKDNILFKKEECFCYAYDSMNLEYDTKIPERVIFVKDIQDVVNVVKYANKHKIPIISRGAGTNMVGACTCPLGGIVLNFSKMNKILDFNPNNMTMKVQPGVVLQDIKDLADSENLFYPPDPSNYRVSTIGGSIALSSGGAKAFKYGTTRDYILSLTVVLANGEILKLGTGTIKDTMGYNLKQLMIGSEGTLAIVVEADLKLIPKPEFTSTVIGYFSNYKDAILSVNKILKSNIFPATIDFMDKNSIKTVEEFHPTGLNIDAECLLLIELDGKQCSVLEQINLMQKILCESNAIEVKTSENKDIWLARASSYSATTKLAPDVLSDDLIVPRENLEDLIIGIKNICGKYNLNVCIVGHVGDGNIHPQIALNLSDKQQYKNYQDAKNEIYNLVINIGGTISSEHGVGYGKMPYFEKFIDKSVIEYMKFIKKSFDPKNILNPNKIFYNK